MQTTNFQPFDDKKTKRKKYILSRIVLSALLFVGLLGFFSAVWYNMVYGDVGVESVLFSVFAGVGGVQAGLVNSWLLNGVLPAVLLTALLILVLLFLPYILYQGRDEERFSRNRKISAIVAFAIIVVSLSQALCIIGFDKWTVNHFSETNIYEQEYVSPDKTKITFPKQKRNLIYIYLESMETTFFAENQGGDLKENVIPELYSLAEDNLNFSQNSKVGGGRAAYGSTWTIGAMLAHTAGIPMRSPTSIKATFTRKFFTNVHSINNILHDNGYKQAVMVGSEAMYGGREEYFLQHDVENVYDIQTAYKDGIVPNGYFEWWGMEDKYLYSYAKQKLGELSQGDKPFAFTMLTVDTHHLDGYKCTECQDKFDNQYSNVLACSSHQLSNFIDWIKKQDFYENTTIVITGDHGTMDYRFIKENTEESYTRRIYNCFINPARETKNCKNREFLTFDMFPTTLSVLGCNIEGDRLGLGTDLFSGKQTLVEKYGFDYAQSELAKSSRFYDTQFD